jgi:hypothetical protein
MSHFEKLGAFYLGRKYDIDKHEPHKSPLLYDAKDLTTHALVVGMTGSGKTGLSVVLLEEAAIDQIPALIIDPKGDMGNLLLSFPKLRPKDLRPWIDESDAAREGMTADEHAARSAETWGKGLRKWGQSKQRISMFRAAVDLAIYTPGSEAGLSLNLLQSFAAPPPAIAGDADALRERILTAVSGLLGLIGIDADPIRSREHILISNIFSRAWSEGRDMDIARLIGEIQSPPFEKLGVMDLESFFPPQDRFALAMQLNNLLASKAFSAWTGGEPLDVNRLLHTPEGRPRLSIFSIAHLSDPERMFFVTLLLNEVIAWMRTQSGTGSLRALLYMDEIFGYFPPSTSPPSKMPMLTLLKQARAFGLGVVLATQNPVDLDYKGLSNTGTWFLGRLQTERDKDRVIEGLQGVSAGRAFGKKELDSLLSNLDKRVFLMHNVHEDEPVLFQTRWALSYLRGPLTRNQVARLMGPRKQVTAQAPREDLGVQQAPAREVSKVIEKPALAPQIREFFLPAQRRRSGAEELLYRPALLASSRLHFVSARAKIDHWDELSMLIPLGGEETKPGDIDWDTGSTWDGDPKKLDAGAEAGASYSELPAVSMRAKSYGIWRKSFASYIYRSHRLNLWKCRALKETSRPGETEGDFRVRMTQRMHERRDLELEKLRKQFAPKLARLQDQLERAEQRVVREKSQYDHQKVQTAISFGATLLGALMGRKLGSARNVGRATTAARSASRAAREKEDIARAKTKVERYRIKLAELEEKFEEKTEQVGALPDPADLDLEEIRIPPRKSDILVNLIALAWTPWKKSPDGIVAPIF